MGGPKIRNRRQVLSSVLAGSLMGIAGCSVLNESDDDSAPSSNGTQNSDGIQDSDGDGVIDSEDYAPQDPDVQERSDVVSEESSSETADSTETATSTPTDETEEDAYSSYDYATDNLEDGGQSANAAGDSYDRENYERAEERYRNALEEFENAVDDFDRAGELASSAGHPEAEEMATHASDITEDYLVSFAEKGINAAEAAQNENFDRAESYIDEMDSLITERNDQEDIADDEEFRSALGL